jgi:hypothetical protein
VNLVRIAHRINRCDAIVLNGNAHDGDELSVAKGQHPRTGINSSRNHFQWCLTFVRYARKKPDNAIGPVYGIEDGRHFAAAISHQHSVLRKYPE